MAECSDEAQPEASGSLEKVVETRLIAAKDVFANAKRRRIAKIILVCLGVLVFLLISFLFVVLPIVLRFSPKILMDLIYANDWVVPHPEFSNLSAHNVESIGRAFYLSGQAGKIGVWHMLPKTMSADYKRKGNQVDESEMERSLSLEDYPVILYCHGNSYDRAFEYRVSMYNLLNRLDYHVVSFDYRGYGDSPGTPNEAGVVSDSRVVYDYVKSHSYRNTLIVWGHSLGSAISTKMVVDLSLELAPPHGLILEAPFSSLMDAFMNTIMSIGVIWMPQYLVNKILVDPLKEYDQSMMETHQRIKTLVICPILIMHAEDDPLLSVALGRKVHQSAKSASRDVQYVEFDSSRSYGHNYIQNAPELLTLIPDFVERAKMKDVGASTFVVVVMLIFLAFCTYILNHSNRLSFRIVRLPLALQAIKYNVTTDEKTTEYTRLKVKRNT